MSAISARVLLAVACVASAVAAQNCGGVLSNTCGLSRVITVPGGSPVLPPQFSTCAPADSFLQGLTIFDVPAGMALQIEISALTADFDLYIHLAPGICESDPQTANYRLADVAGAAGTSGECEILTPVELAAYACGWLAVAVICKDPAGGSCTLSVSCVAAGSVCGTTPPGNCPGICGDCNVDGMGPNILDALTAARIGAGALAATPTQLLCCDVNASASVNILDALLIAQRAAGLMVMLVCP